MLDIRDLSFSYFKNGRPLLQNLSFSLDKGGIYGLLGANGEGKSTLLYLISGLLRPRGGQVLYDGLDTVERRPQTLADLFLVPEEYEFPSMPLAEYLLLTAPLYPRFDRDRFNACLNDFKLPANIHLGALSMGQRKKVLIAFALAANTGLLLMDEPTNGLDIPAKADFRRILAEAASPGRTIIVSTHQVRDFDRSLTDIILMAGHKVVLCAPVTDVCRRLLFEYGPTPGAPGESLFSEAVPGGYNIVRSRPADMPLPFSALDAKAYTRAEVNLETLFNFAYQNPQLLQAAMTGK